MNFTTLYCQQTTNHLIGGDFNSRHEIWDSFPFIPPSEKPVIRGRVLKNIFEQRNYIVLNDS